MAISTVPPGNTVPLHTDHHGSFLRHVAEMVLVMIPGMFVGGAVFTIAAGLAAGESLTFDEARIRYPEACLLTIGVVMSVPMVGWMRHRGHSWQLAGEMAIAMLVPAIALICLFWLDAIGSESLCGAYCAIMIPAMIGAMLYRRDQYGHSAHESHILSS